MNLFNSCKKIHSRLICIFMVVSYTLTISAQTDANALHFWTDRSPFSPSYLVPMTHASLLGRMQQVGYEGQPLSFWGCFSQYKPKLRSLFGGKTQFDLAGYTSTVKIDGNYIFSLGSDNDRVNLGLEGGAVVQQKDVNKISADDMDDASLYDNNEVNPNFSFGVEWIHKRRIVGTEDGETTVGISAKNMEDWLTRQDRRITVNAFYLYGSYRRPTLRMLHLYTGGMMQLYDSDRLQGEIHVALIKAKNREVDAWACGISCRHSLVGNGSTDLIINAGVALGSHLYLGYSFDLVVHGDFASPFSSHEIILEYKFKDKRCHADKSTYYLMGGK